MYQILDFFDVLIVPVELVSFDAAISSGKVVLNWKTATEVNNAGFEIERSENNSNFTKIGYVNGSGTTTEINEYSFTDNSLEQIGKYYYRLKQIDLDGSFEYSNTVSVNFSDIPVVYNLFQNYPNPFNPQTTIKISLPFESEVKLIVYNSIGQEVATLINNVMEAGYHELLWNGISVASGVYLYRLTANPIDGNNGAGYSSVKKMVMVK